MLREKCSEATNGQLAGHRGWEQEGDVLADHAVCLTTPLQIEICSDYCCSEVNKELVVLYSGKRGVFKPTPNCN